MYPVLSNCGKHECTCPLYSPLPGNTLFKFRGIHMHMYPVLSNCGEHECARPLYSPLPGNTLIQFRGTRMHMFPFCSLPGNTHAHLPFSRGSRMHRSCFLIPRSTHTHVRSGNTHAHVPFYVHFGETRMLLSPFLSTSRKHACTCSLLCLRPKNTQVHVSFFCPLPRNTHDRVPLLSTSPEHT